MGAARWSMLLSHHVPQDYDRTWLFGSVRVCVRCLGVFLGTAFTLLLGWFWSPAKDIPIPLAILVAIPGMFDFTLHELGKSASSSTRRFVTGLIFGIYVTAFLRACVDLNMLIGLCLLGWFLLLQMISAILLQKAGKLEPFLMRHQHGYLTHCDCCYPVSSEPKFNTLQRRENNVFTRLL